MMKVLLVTPRYWPDNFRVVDIAETLVKRGHVVTVLTGLPCDTNGHIKQEYKNNKNRKEIHNGVEILRVNEKERGNNFLKRFLNYYSFPARSKKILKHLNLDFDVVLYNELSPIISAKPALFYKKIYGAKVLMYEMDLWPENLTAGGIKKNSLVYNYYKKVSGKIYSQVDKILTSTFEHIDYIKHLPYCSNCNIDYLPQYAEEIFENCNIEQIDNGIIDLMFAGNIGKAQSVETIIKAANILKNDKRYMFHIVGNGICLDNLKKLAAEYKLQNIKFYGELPLEKMPEFYSLADVMLATYENKDYANMTIPGKIQSYMAFGKPIIVAANGATNNLIKDSKSGLAVEAENYIQLAEAITKIDKDNLVEFGLNSKKYYTNNFKKEKFINVLEENLFSLLKK